MARLTGLALIALSALGCGTPATQPVVEEPTATPSAETAELSRPAPLPVGTKVPTPAIPADFEPPRIVNRVEPDFELIRGKTLVGGRVVVKVTLDKEGQVVSTELLKGVDPKFDESVLESARLSTYQPATKGGQPVETEYIYTAKLLLM